MVSAWLTFTCYLLIFFTFDHEDMNQVDRIAIHDVRRVANYFLSFLRRNSTSISLPVIKQIALVLSDQQLITGTSVFVAAYADTCGITQYHFIVAYYLGCAGFLTHQSTLMISSDTMRHRVFMRAWRLLWVAVIFAFIPAANVIILNQSFSPVSGKPLQCSFEDSGPSKLLPDRISFLALSCFCWTWGFYAVTRNLCPEGWDALKRWLQPTFQKLRQHFRFLSIGRLYLWAVNGSLTAKEQYNVYFFWWPIHSVVFVFFLIYYTIAELLCSNLTHLYRICVPLTSVTYATYKLRSGAIGHDRHEQAEYTWSFGQVMPLGLLALPLFQVLEMLFSMNPSSPPPNFPVQTSRLTVNIDDWRKQRQLKKEYNKVQDSGEPEEYLSNNSSHGRMPSLGYPSTTQDGTRDNAHTTTTEQEHGDKAITFGLRRADTENGKWATTESGTETETQIPGYSNCSSPEVQKQLEDRMYGSIIFRMWMRLVMAGVFAASGYAISVVTTA